LRAAVRELAGESLDALCDGLLEALLDGGFEDDVALLAVRAPRQPAEPPAEWALPAAVLA